MKPIIAKEIETLKTWSMRASEKNLKPLDFNGFKPLIQKSEFGWKCSGMHPSGFPSYGFGPTPEDAYIDWTYDNIPF